jgi:hypothetical protein
VRMSKTKARAHQHACELLKKPKLSLDDRFEVLRKWQAGASPLNGIAGAFFTPAGLARDLAVAMPVCSGRIVDLCAGIGSLAFAAWRYADEPSNCEIVCVEINPVYVGVGRKVLPEATWICADVFALPDLGRFDIAIANPPFGSTSRSGRAPRYSGREFEFHVIDIASDCAKYGTFLVPQESAPFVFSGVQGFRWKSPAERDRYDAFSKSTGIELTENVGVDTSFYADEWEDVEVVTEIVLADFTDLCTQRERERLRNHRPQTADLFADIA